MKPLDAQEITCSAIALLPDHFDKSRDTTTFVIFTAIVTALVDAHNTRRANVWWRRLLRWLRHG